MPPIPTQSKRAMLLVVTVVSVVASLFYISGHFVPNNVSVSSSYGGITLKTDLNQNYDVFMHKDRFGQNTWAPTDYYVLVLSWSPGFCHAQEKQMGKISSALQYQCNSEQQFGWIVHGLWPQSASASKPEEQPRFCQGDLAPVDRSLLQRYLIMSPGLQLLQGEWEKHGACAFNDPESYFNMTKKLYQNLVLPEHDMPRKDLLRFMRKYNPQLRDKYLGIGMNELRICYDTQWQPVNCPAKYN